LDKLKDKDIFQSEIETLLTTIKTAVSEVKDVVFSSEKKSWIKSLAKIIISQSGFVNQLTKMRDCYIESKNDNAKLAQKLLGSYKP